MVKKHIIICLALLLVMLSGCQPKTGGETSGEKASAGDASSGDIQQTKQIIEFPSSYQRSGEHVTIDIEAITPQSAYFTEGTVELAKLNGEEIGVKLVPEDETEVVEEPYEGSGSRLSKGRVDNYYEKLFSWGRNYFGYTTYDVIELWDSINEEKRHPEYNLPLYAEEKTFAFGSADEALEVVKDQLKEFGIVIDDTYIVSTYYLDHETLMQEEEHIDMEGNIVMSDYKTDWSEEDDAYMFYITQTYCDLPDYHTKEKASSRAEDSSAQIQAVYGKEGILYLRVSEIAVYDMGDKQTELLPFEEIADIVLNHYDNILDDTTYQVTDARLVCDYETTDYTVAKNSIIPVWAFTVTETYSSEYSVETELRVNASTGAIIR